MNKFDTSTKFFLQRNGHLVTYIQVSNGTYDVETGSITNTEISSNVKAYPKIVKANQFNYPNLIDKKVIEFLVSASELGKEPKVNDKITYNTDTYSVVDYMVHSALGDSVMYRIVTTKL
jgi:hypothetical protein